MANRQQMLAQALAQQSNVTTGAASPQLRTNARRRVSAPAVISAARANLLDQQNGPVPQTSYIAPVDAQMVNALGDVGLSVWSALRKKKQDQQRAQLLADELALQRGQDPYAADTVQPIEPPSMRGITPKAPQELENPQGMTEPGNLDPYDRKTLQNPDGSVSTTSSFSVGTDKGETLLPSVVDGQRLSKQRPDGSTDFGPAVDHYNQTGENLGSFGTAEDADKYANMLHGEQAAVMGLREPGFEDAGLADALLAQKKGQDSYAAAKASTKDQEAPAVLEHDTAAMLDPAVAPFAAQRLFPKPAEPFTLGENQARFNGAGKEVARGPEKKVDKWEPFTDANGNQMQRNTMTGEVKPAGAATPQDPESIREYNFAKAGGYTGSYTDYQMLMGRSKAPRQENPPAPGYRNVFDEQGNLVRQEMIPGGPAEIAAAKEKRAQDEADAKAAKAQGKEDKARANEVQGADIVATDIGRIRNTMTGPGFSGVGATASLKDVPVVGSYTNARAISDLIKGIKANIGFAQLNQMRAASPTGGALGNVTEREQDMLQSALGALEQSGNPGVFAYNLDRLENIYLDIIHGPGQGPPRRTPGEEPAPAAAPAAPAQPGQPAPAAAAPSADVVQRARSYYDVNIGAGRGRPQSTPLPRTGVLP